MFPGLATITASKIQIPMVIFQALQLAGGSLMTIAFRRWIQSDEEREAAVAKAEQDGDSYDDQEARRIQNSKESHPPRLGTLVRF